jgi:hypothetical protein
MGLQHCDVAVQKDVTTLHGPPLTDPPSVMFPVEKTAKIQDWFEREPSVRDPSAPYFRVRVRPGGIVTCCEAAGRSCQVDVHSRGEMHCNANKVCE